MPNHNKDQYKIPQGYIANPFDFLYQRDVEPSKESYIQEFLEAAGELADSIPTEIEDNLDYYKFRINYNDLTFADNGLILAKIRFNRSYKKKYSSFTEYCNKELGRSRSYCDRLITSSRVILELITNGFSLLPRNESQCRILASRAGSELIKVWKAITETIEPHKITVRSIEKFLCAQEEPKPESDTNIPLPNHLERAIHPYASSKGLSVSSFVIMLLEQIFKPKIPKSNWRDFQKEEEWELDTNKLVEEAEAILDSG